MEFLTEVLLIWVHQKESVEAARAASNLLLLCYFVGFIFIKQAAFIVAFLLIEFISNSTLTIIFSAYQIHLLYVVMYSIIYWYGVCNRFKIETLFGYVIMVFFQIVMSIDAFIFPDTETFVYQNYILFVVAIHLYIIYTTFRREKLRRLLGNITDSLRVITSNNYNFALYLLLCSKQAANQIK